MKGGGAVLAKKKVIFECMACGYQSPKWMGKPPPFIEQIYFKPLTI
jgi:DNA repair protein RadA/Sms